MDSENRSDAELTEILYEALHDRFNDYNHWLYAREVPVTTGFSETRIDAVTMSCYKSEGFRIDGYEVKASQSDLKVELVNPSKHQLTYENVDYFWLVTAPHVLKGIYDELPKKWGVLVIKDDKSLRMRRNAMALEDKVETTTSKSFISSFLRRAVYQDRSDQKLVQIREEAYESGRQSILRLNETLGHVDKLTDTIRRTEEALGITHSYYVDSSEKIVLEIERLKERAVADPRWIMNELDKMDRTIKDFQRYVKDFKKRMPSNSDSNRRWY